jgi:hypothetical protein
MLQIMNIMEIQTFHNLPKPPRLIDTYLRLKNIYVWGDFLTLNVY